MRISRVIFFRRSALLPLIVPVPLGAVLIASVLVGVKLPHWFSDAVGLAAMGAFLFAAPYAAVAGIILYVLRHRSWKAHASAALAAPWLMIAAVAFFDVSIDRSSTWSSAVETWAAHCLKLGYGYIVLTFLGLVVFQRLGWVVDDAAS
jgi:hypothetical protein